MNKTSSRHSVINLAFQTGTFQPNKQTLHMAGTHPPAGPVEGTLEHRPQLAMDRETILMTHYTVKSEIRTMTEKDAEAGEGTVT